MSAANSGAFQTSPGRNFGTAAEQPGCWMFGVRNDFLRRPDFDGVTFPHHHNAMTDVFDDGEIVRDENHGDAPLALDVLQQVDDLRADGNVQCADGFIADKQARLDGERAGDADALTLAAAEFVRITINMLSKQPDRSRRSRTRASRSARDWARR